MRVLALPTTTAAREGVRDAAAWLAHHGRRDRGECRRRLRLARAFARRGHRALRVGEVSLAQRGHGACSTTCPPRWATVRSAAEERLLARPAVRAAIAAGARPPGRGRRGARGREGLEARQLEQEEARAARRTYLTTRRNGDGTTDIRIRVADLVCARLLTYLDAFTAPPPDASTRSDDRRPYDRRLGRRRRVPRGGRPREAPAPRRRRDHPAGDRRPRRAPRAARHRARSATSRSGSGGPAAGLHRGDRARVLGGHSQVLDLGRTRRLFSPSQRKALAVRQPTAARRLRHPRRVVRGPPRRRTVGAAVAPTLPTASCSARSTITERTTPTTAPIASPTAACGSTGGREASRVLKLSTRAFHISQG